MSQFFERIKKLVACVLCFTIGCTTIVSLLPISLLALSIGNGPFDYIENEDGKISIFAYTGTEVNVVVPSEIDGKTVIEVQSCTFFNCTDIVSVELPDTLESVPSFMFDGCTSLQRVVLPSYIYDIEVAMFEYCPSLTSVTMPETVCFIKEYAFRECSSLESINIPEKVLMIDDCAFENCTSLGEVYIPNSVVVFGEHVFRGCDNLVIRCYANSEAQKYAIAENIPYVLIQDNTASGNPIDRGDWSYELLLDSTARITDYNGDDIAVEIPLEIDGYTVTAIGDNAFAECQNMQSIYIPSSVTEIGENAFLYCTSLTEIELPYGIKSVANNTFMDCSALENVVLPPTIEYIGASAFAGCESLNEIGIPDSVTIILSEAFAQSGLESLYIPSSVVYIGESAFSICTSLGNLEISSDVENLMIDDDAFGSCESLTEVVLPNGVISVGENCFSLCSSLETVDFAESITNIEDYSFQELENLRSVTLRGVETIGVLAFEGCTNLQEVNVSEDLKIIRDGAFRDCTSLSEINGMTAVEEIEGGVFAGCSSLTEFYFPSSLFVCDGAFGGCSGITSVTLEEGIRFVPCLLDSPVIEYHIPESVEFFCREDLVDNDSLARIYVYGYMTEITGDPNFGDIEIYCYNGSMTQWYADTNGLNYTLLDAPTPTITSTSTPIPTVTVTSTPTMTATPIPTATSTPTPIATDVPVVTEVPGSGELSYRFYDYESNPISGVQISVVVSEDTVIYGVTGSNGEVVFADIPVGGPYEIIIDESTIPSHLELSDESRSVSIYNDCSIERTEYLYGYTYWVNEDNTITIGRYHGDRTDVIVPSVIDGIRVRVIESGAFGENSTIESVTFPHGVEVIGGGCFINCQSLTEVNLPYGLLEIYSDVFYGCPNLEEVIIPSTVQYFGEYMFEESPNLTSVIFNGSVDVISEDAFTGCSSDLVVSCYEGTNIHQFVVANNIPFVLIDSELIDESGLYRYEMLPDETIAIVDYLGTEEIVLLEIPSEIDGKPVTVIGESAFMECNTIGRIVIPDSVTNIGNSAFENCSARITLSSSLVTIGDDAFGYTSFQDSDLVLPDTLIELGSNSLRSLSAFRVVTIPRSVQIIEEGAIRRFAIIACYSDSRAHQYAIENNIAYMLLDGESEDVVYPEDVFYFENNNGQIELVDLDGYCGDITLPSEYEGNEVNGIAPWTIVSERTVVNVVIPDGYTYIGETCFQANDLLESVTVPSSVTEIGRDCFTYNSDNFVLYCYTDSVAHQYAIDNNINYSLLSAPSPTSTPTDPLSVYEYEVQEDETIIITNYVGVDSVDILEIPSEIDGIPVTEIGANAFQRASNVGKIIIPNSVTVIGERAFNSLSGTEIVLSDSLVSIGDYAFEYCYFGDSLALPNSLEVIGRGAFNALNDFDLITLTVPDSVQDIGQFGIREHAIVACNTGSYAHQYAVDNNLAYILLDSDTQEVIYPDDVFSYINNNGENEIIGYSGYSSRVVIPSEYNGEQIVGIADNTFSWYSDTITIEEIIISDGITYIGSDCFNMFYRLTSVTIPNSVVEIGDGCFEMNANDVVLYCYTGSAAHLYAMENNISFRLIDNPNATATPTPTEVPTATPTVVPTVTMTPYPTTATPVPTHHPTVPVEPSLTPEITSTPIPTATPSLEPTATPTAVPTATSTPMPTATSTPVPTATSTPMPTATSTPMPTATSTPMPTATSTPMPTATSMPTPTIDPDWNGNEDEILYADSFYYYINAQNTVTLIKYDGVSNDVVIPSEINGVDVTELSSELFSEYYYALGSVTIPASVTSIQGGALDYCLSIGGTYYCYSNTEAFRYCRENFSYRNVVLLDGYYFKYDVTEDSTITITEVIGSDISSIIVPSSIEGMPVTSINEYAFNSNTEIISIELPDGLMHIGNGAFSNCTALRTINLPNSIVSIGGWAFSNCTSLEEIDLPDGITVVESQTFQDCSSLSSVIMHDGLTTIGHWAFMNSAVEEVVIPSSVETINSMAFRGCGQLRRVVLPEGVTMLSSSLFDNCSSLEEVIIPNGVDTIDFSCFSGCSSLTDIEIPETVTTIGTGAFINCTSLGEVYIPNSVVDIGEGVFVGCNNILIQCYRVSCIHEYAEMNDISHLLLDGEETPTTTPSVTSTPMPTATSTPVPTATSTPVPTATSTPIPTATSTPAPGEIPPPTGNTVDREAAVDFSTRCYELVLDRTPDSTGLNNWTNSLVNNQNTGAHMAYGFFFSPEYLNSNTSNEEFVTTLYNVFLDRAPDQGGLNDWVGQLEAGASREQVFAGVANSREFFGLCNGYGITAGHYVQGLDNTQQQNVNAFVARLYSMCLGRNGDYAGQEAWVRQLINHENSGAGVAYGFFFSQEFINRNLTNEEYVATLYRVFLGREPDQGGFDSWVAQLDNGADRLSIFRGFAHSQEFTNICNSYGIDRGSV